MTPSSKLDLASEPTAADRRRWIALLDGLDVDSLTERFLVLVRDIPAYDPSPLPLAELRRACRLAIAALIESLRSGKQEHIGPIAQDLGTSRARAGVPLASLLTAIRCDFTVLWNALIDSASAADAQLIVKHTTVVLDAVEEYASRTQRSYAEETARMRDEAHSLRQGRIAALFDEPPPTSEVVAAIAAELDLPPDEPLIVAAALPHLAANIHTLLADRQIHGTSIFTHHLGDSLVLFAKRSNRPGSGAQALEERLLHMPVGIVVARRGTFDLRRCAFVARDLASFISDGATEAMTAERGWARFARAQVEKAGLSLLSDVDVALANCGPTERQRLTCAVESFLSTGSINLSAEELGCHRNTVANRLRRFASVTRVDPTVPEDAARLVVGWA